MNTWTYMNIKGQGHSLTLVQGHSDSTFSNFFFLETAWPIEAKFYMEPAWDGGMKVWSNGQGHMTKMAAMPLCGKNLKKNIFSGTKRLMTLKVGVQHWVRVLPIIFKWWPWDDLDLFGPMLLYGTKVKQ